MHRIDFDGRAVTPSKIICVGRNYVEHIRELGNVPPPQMVLFMKPNSAISDQLHAQDTDTLHYEAEICFLVENAQLAGIGFGLDITRRELQAQLKAAGLPWERAKAFDGAAVFSAFRAFAGSAQDLRLELDINGNPAQRGAVPQMIHSPEQILAEIKRFASLEDGDIIMTGTPAGVGPLRRGDHYTGRIFQDTRMLIEQHWTVL